MDTSSDASVVLPGLAVLIIILIAFVTVIFLLHLTVHVLHDLVDVTIAIMGLSKVVVVLIDRGLGRAGAIGFGEDTIGLVDGMGEVGSSLGSGRERARRGDGSSLAFVWLFVLVQVQAA